jgi:hypothetical protein
MAFIQSRIKSGGSSTQAAQQQASEKYLSALGQSPEAIALMKTGP